MSSIKYTKPQTTSSSQIHPTAIKESSKEVNQPTEAEKNIPHDSDDKDQTSEMPSSTIDSEDKDQTQMDYAIQDEVLEKEEPK